MIFGTKAAKEKSNQRTKIMKTIFRVAALSGLFILVLVFFICTQLNAQTIISIDSSSDSTVVVKFPDKDYTTNQQRLILIIDNAPASYQLSEAEVLAWLDSRNANFSPSVIYLPPTEKSEIVQKDENLIDYLVETTLNEEVETEEELEIEEWMYTSENWLSK